MVIESTFYLPPKPKHAPFPEHDPDEKFGAQKMTFTRIGHGEKIEKTNWTEVGQQPKTDDDPDWRGVIKNQVQPMPAVEPYKHRYRRDPKNYIWFDTPDYADPFKKLWHAFKWWGLASAAYASANLSFEGQSLSLASLTRGVKKYYIPFFGIAMASSATIVTVANIRKKDDLWNYAAGGLMWSSIWGRKHYIRWFRSTVLMVPLFVYTKYEMERNGKLLPILYDYGRSQDTGLGVLDHKHGVMSGDWRFGLRIGDENPGRLPPREY